MAHPRRILFLTCSERGQANVFLAVLHEIARIDASVNLHLCSFTPLAEIASALPAPPTFHEISEPSLAELLFECPDSGFAEQAALHPTMWNAWQSANLVSRVGCPWTPEQLSRIIRRMQGVIKDVEPDLIVIDNICSPAITVCVAQKSIPWIVLSPNSYREFITAFQPNLQVLWKHPAPRAIIPFPVPWYLIPSSAYQLLLYALADRNAWSQAHRKNMRENHDIEFANISYIAQMLNPPPSFKVLCPSLPETDFHFDIYPPHVLGCGPILLPALPVEEVNPDLAAWLKKRPTLFIALGTHATYTDEEAAELGRSLRHVLEEARQRGKDLQVLWKLKRTSQTANGMKEGLGPVESAIGEDFLHLVRITPWLEVDPIAILKSGSIICAVNHGGANSFWEALSAGIPQVILPTWYDTYDIATRAEYLGVGRFGSRKAAPRCAADELGPILVDVVFGEEGEAIRAKVKHLAAVCKASGEGRTVAAQAILAEVRGSNA